jgi:uncharacterized protein (DUF924 family)
VSDDEDELASAPPPADWSEQILHFWFDDHDDASWFGGGPAFDAEVAKNFAGWHEALRGQPVDAFLTGSETALAAIILFDQVPRNAFRDTALAFSTDHLALAISRRAVEFGFDTELDNNKRLFVYLPFEHSEDIDDQRTSVRLISGLKDQRLLQFAMDHKVMIERFGRFPHRNKALGRADRPGEAEAVAAGGGW